MTFCQPYPRRGWRLNPKRPKTRLYTPLAGGGSIRLDDEKTARVTKVLRLEPGDITGCFSDGSEEFQYEVLRVTRKAVELRLVGSHPCLANPTQPLILVQAVGKSGKVDEVVKTATALGVTGILFIPTQRTVGRLQPDRKDRLDTLALEACRQCGRTSLPKIDILTNREDWWTSPELPVTRLFADEEGGLPLAEAAPTSSGTAIAIGPEGGWTDEERSAFREADWQPVSLGPRVLRTELAAVAALAILGAECGR